MEFCFLLAGLYDRYDIAKAPYKANNTLHYSNTIADVLHTVDLSKVTGQCAGMYRESMSDRANQMVDQLNADIPTNCTGIVVTKSQTSLNYMGEQVSDTMQFGRKLELQEANKDLNQSPLIQTGRLNCSRMFPYFLVAI